MLKSPGGTTTISTQSGQSRKTSPGSGTAGAAGGAGVWHWAASDQTAARMLKPGKNRMRMSRCIRLLPLTRHLADPGPPNVRLVKAARRTKHRKEIAETAGPKGMLVIQKLKPRKRDALDSALISPILGGCNLAAPDRHRRRRRRPDRPMRTRIFVNSYWWPSI